MRSRRRRRVVPPPGAIVLYLALSDWAFLFISGILLMFSESLRDYSGFVVPSNAITCLIYFVVCLFVYLISKV